MGKTQQLLKTYWRKIIAIVFFFVCMFLLQSINNEDTKMITNMMSALLLTCLFVFIRWLMNDNKNKK
ncbi:hypothetical protein BK130_02860 [Viridibacillus sp. FSL H8-0123]|uniref:Uncharacterized protein n=1 Tax=Viridibacillus arenosi FSL R5-213 TaxID=1227360 RepID=W4F1A7_9BACL|nr:hypothetical protein C176_07522 [Viridibacillus arenosi FSL R5-213]OMC84581.1 hypothetical protein BK130_02860 [Viridibacillus sp. FSL H8-0123]OMC91629.1 hypothetical protein BK137_06815 [Viridibacillus arenosi]